MPNFHAHWLVALQAIDALPEAYRYLKQGRNAYCVLARELGKEVAKEVKEILATTDPSSLVRRRPTADIEAAAKLQKFIAARVEEFEKAVRGDLNAICFSAYMLGACGPDFWTLPSETFMGTVPDTAGVHFDLGHYNRTHRQFEVSIKAIDGGDGPQERLEKSYFLGMATHLGADLVLHQLVNVYAGAYNLLRTEKMTPHGMWSNEQAYEWLSPSGSAPQAMFPEPPDPGASWWKRGLGWAAYPFEVGAHYAMKPVRWAAHGVGEGVGKAEGDRHPIWTTHNKVEHYWDTWVRYRWLGDFGQVWQGQDVDLAPKLEFAGLPLCDTIRWRQLKTFRAVRALGTAQGDPAADLNQYTRDLVDYALGSVETRALLEKPLAFPWLFCDTILEGHYRPFVYDRVVKKQGGAYPEELIFEEAKREAKHDQMRPPAPPKPANPGKGLGKYASMKDPSEKKKLEFFSTPRNEAIPPTSWNYLNYIVCPGLERLLAFGDDKFYDRTAFPPFVGKAVRVASAFAADLAGAYSPEKPPLAKLPQFWNLDTGLGLEVQGVPSPDRHEVVTRLDWVHILGSAGIGQPVDYEIGNEPQYAARTVDAKGKPGHRPKAKEPYPLEAWNDWNDKECAFRTYRQEFPSLGAVHEEEGVIEERRYLDHLRLEDPFQARWTHPIHDRLAKVGPQKTDDDKAFVDALYVSDGPASGAGVERVASGEAVVAKASRWAHRIGIEVRASIAKLGADASGVAMYLLADDPDAKLLDGVPPKDPVVEGKPYVNQRDGKKDKRGLEAATKWLLHGSKVLERGVLEPEAGHSGLATFSTRILVNACTEREKDRERKVKPDEWNNVIPYAKHQGHYGRNFAVTTARKHTLRATNDRFSNNFDATTDFEDLAGFGLTEHCFFTLYPLVLIEGKWIDAFSKKEIGDAEAFMELKKVEAINFVKIVLLYVLDQGLVQLPWCYVDGVRKPLKPSAD